MKVTYKQSSILTVDFLLQPPTEMNLIFFSCRLENKKMTTATTKTKDNNDNDSKEEEEDSKNTLMKAAETENLQLHNLLNQLTKKQDTCFKKNWLLP